MDDTLARALSFSFSVVVIVGGTCTVVFKVLSFATRTIERRVGRRVALTLVTGSVALGAYCIWCSLPAMLQGYIHHHNRHYGFENVTVNE